MSKSQLAKTFWEKFNQTAKAEYHLCEKEISAFSLIPKTVLTKTILSIGESLVGYWDSLVKDNWASLNPRIMKRTFSNGTIREGFKRTWIAPAPAGSNLEIIVKKRIASKTFPGKLGGTITVEKFDSKGKVIERKSVTFKDGKYESTRTISLTNDTFGYLIVTVDTPLKPGKSFAYSIRYKEKVIRKSYGKITGFADIHNHLSAEYAYAGNWMHGKMMGSPAQALAACNNSNHKKHGLKSVVINDLQKSAEGDPTASIVIESGNGHPNYTQWPHHLDIIHQQMHEDWVKQAFNGGMKLMVACAVNSEMLSLILGGPLDKDQWRDMNCLSDQIDKIHEFCERNKSWAEISYNPWHAREIINKNKLAIVLAIEASNIFPPDQGHYIAQLDEMYCKGVRSVIMVHHVDNRFGGAAPQERQLTTAQTLSAATRASLISNNSLRDNKIFPYLRPGKGDKFLGFDLDENGKSKRGLSTSGVELVNAMMDRHMLIDVSHNSTKTFEDVYDIAQRRKYYPLFESHTKFESILSSDEKKTQREFLTTDDKIEKLKKTGGIVGLRTAPWSNQKSCCLGAPVTDETNTAGTTRNYAQQVAYANKKKINVAFGSDFNGFTNQLGPRSKNRKLNRTKPVNVSSDYWNNGLRHIGLLPDVVNDLVALRTPGAAAFNQSAEKFLLMWQRCWDKDRTMVDIPSRAEPVRVSATIKNTGAKKPIMSASIKKKTNVKPVVKKRK